MYGKYRREAALPSKAPYPMPEKAQQKAGAAAPAFFDHLNFLFLAASDFFLRLTEGFS